MPTKPCILVFAEVFDRGGLEEFLRHQARDLKAKGIDCHLVTGSPVDGATEDCFASVLPNQPLGLDATYARFRYAWQEIMAFARARQVTHVHGHPFVTLLFAHFFAHGLRVPLALTLHGPISLDWDYGPFCRVMFRNVVLPAAQTVCCVSPETQFLCRVLGRDTTLLTPNTAPPGQTSSSPLVAGAWMWAGRIDLDKSRGLLDLVEKMRGLGKRLTVYGDGPHRASVQQGIEADPELRTFVTFEGWSGNLDTIYPRFEMVAGMGRVVIEAGTLGRPCFLVGYDGVKCLLDRETIEAAAYSNFSGRSFQTMPVDQFRKIAESWAGMDQVQMNVAAWFRQHRNPDVLVESYIEQLSHSTFVEDRATDALLQYSLWQAPADRPIFQDPFLTSILERMGGSGVHTAVHLDKQNDIAAEVYSLSSALRQAREEIATQSNSEGKIQVPDGEIVHRNAQIADLQRKLEMSSGDVAHRDAQIADLQRKLETLSGDVAHRDAQIADLQRKLETLSGDVARRDAQIADLQIKLETFSGDVVRRDAQIYDLQRKLETSVLEVVNRDAQIVALTKNCERQEAVAKNRTSTLQATLVEREEEKKLWSRELEQAAMALEDHRHALAALREQNEAQSNRINDLVGSTSWRVTAPLRVASGATRLTITSPSLTIARLGVLTREARRSGPGAAFKWLSIRFGSGPVGEANESLPTGYIRGPEPSVTTTTVGGANVPFDALEGAETVARAASVATQQVRPYRSGLVSIILPVYNQASFLGDAIESILQQTYTNWELIIVNDGSTDDFETKVAPYISDPRLRIFHQPNQKLPSALNNGFREARGEFFTWTSADNIVLENWLERLIVALQLNPTAGLAYSDYIAIDDRGAELGDPEWRRHNRPTGTARLHLPTEVTATNFHDSGDNFLGASFMWRAEVHEVVGSHDENTFGGEDYDFWLRMNMVTPFTHVAQSLYLYRVHDNTLNARAKELKLFENIQRLLANDRDRRSALLLASSDLANSSRRLDYWRDARQYRLGATSASYLRYSQISHPLMPDASEIKVVRIDVPLREIDLKLVQQADILVTSDALSYCWLREAPRDPRQRLLFVDEVTGEVGLAHAVALRRFEKMREAEGYFLAQKPRAQAAMLLPHHVLLTVSRWGNGGLEQVVVDLASRLIGRGVAVVIACCEGQPSREMRDVCAALRIEPIGFDGSPSKLLAYVRASGIDLVNYHHASLAAQELAEAGIRTIYTVHNSYVWFSATEIAKLRDQLTSMSEFVAVSREVAQYAHRWLGAPADRIHVIPNGVDLASPQASLNRSGDAIPEIPQGYRFLNAATFNRLKNQDKLIKAFASLAKEHAGVHLTLVGSPADVDFLEEIKALRRSLSLCDRVTIIEGTSRANVLQLMSTHDCFVLPSIVEGWSISLAEAILSGMTVVASDVGSARDVQSLSEAVVLVPGLADDLQTVHQTELRLLTLDSGTLFINRLQTALRDAWVRRDTLKRKAAEAVPLAQDMFSLNRALICYLQMIASK
jgi:glycosyltransferase involved in cell wall biosynthesis